MLHHNFFYGVLRERDGVRERLFLWRSVYGTPSQWRSRGLTATACRSPYSTSKSDSFWSSRSISTVAFGARPGRSRSRVLPELGQSAQAGQRCRRRPCAPSDETDTTGQLYYTDAFFFNPTIVYFKPVSPIPSSPCTTCGRRGASKEKKSVGSWFVAESASPLGGELS